MLNQPATLNRCMSDSAFHPTLLECVSWDEWEWQPTCAPLTVIVKLLLPLAAPGAATTARSSLLAGVLVR